MSRPRSSSLPRSAYGPEAVMNRRLLDRVFVSNVLYADTSQIGRRLDMLRREFIAGAATFALLARLSRAHAQQSATRRARIGILIYSTPERDPNTQAFLEGLRQLGYVD